MSEQPFGSTMGPDGLRHAAVRLVTVHGRAKCDQSLMLAWLEPLQPGQRVCQRPTCKAAAEQARKNWAKKA